MCLFWASEFLLASCWRSNTSFVLVGVAAQHPPDGSVPRSMVATCWRFSPWCLRQRHTSPRFFSPQLPPSLANYAALYFWIQNLTDHMELQSIFLPFWRSKRALFTCISVCPVLHLWSPSVITAPCWVHPCSFVSMKVCSTLYYYALMFMVSTEKKDDVYIRRISAHVVVCKSFFEVQTHFTFSMYFKKSCLKFLPRRIPFSPLMATINSQDLYGFYQCLINT